MTRGRVVADVRNEPVDADEVADLLRPLVDLLGIDFGDVQSLRVDRKAIRLRVVLRNRAGRRLPDSWANVVVKLDEKFGDDKP